MTIRFARVVSGIVAEVVNLPSDVALEDAFHADLVPQFHECPDEVEAGWIYDGSSYKAPVAIEIVTITVLAAVTLWERMTEAEAEQVETVMATQPFRTRQIFITANTFRSDHELWPLLVQIATSLFGEVRATELLAP